MIQQRKAASGARTVASGSDTTAAVGALVMMLFAALGCLVAIGLTPFGPALDEWETWSYAVDVQRHGPAAFFQNDLHLLDPQTMRFSGAPNPLAHHPPGFPFVLSVLPLDAIAATDGRLVRVVSLLCVAIGNALLVHAVIGRRTFATPEASVLLLAIALLFWPTLMAAGLLATDAPAYLLGCLFAVAALSQMRTGRETALPGRAVFLFAFSIAAAGWTKATAFLQLALMGIAFVALHVEARNLLRDRRSHALAAALVLGALPYLWNIAVHGRPLLQNYSAMEFTPVAAADIMVSPADFALAWFLELANTAVFGWRDVLHAGMGLLVSLVLLVGLSARHGAIGRIVLAAAAVAVPVHVVQSHGLHLEYGMSPHNAGAHARLYLPLMPAAALASAFAIDRLGRSWRLAAVSTVLVLLVMAGPGMVLVL